MAEVSISELDILDLEADHSWAPNFIGIAEGQSERIAITTFGMSEFHFSQNGQELDFRTGINATLSKDLALPYVITNGDDKYVEPTAGVSVQISLDKLILDDIGEIELRTAQSETRIFQTTDSNNTVIFRIPTVDF
jgi:hypothetical protein